MADERTPEGIAAQQQEAHRRAAVRFGELFREYNASNSDWSYVPPTSDDPEEWQGITKWCALEVSYVWHCQRESQLRLGKRPTYCTVHDEKAEGHRPMPCFRCAWDSDLYDRAISNARRLGRQWSENVRAGREMAVAS